MVANNIPSPLLEIGNVRPRGFSWTIEIRHPRPDPFDYRIHARTALDAVAIVTHMRSLGRGAWIVEVAACARSGAPGAARRRAREAAAARRR